MGDRGAPEHRLLPVVPHPVLSCVRDDGGQDKCSTPLCEAGGVETNVINHEERGAGGDSRRAAGLALAYRRISPTSLRHAGVLGRSDSLTTATTDVYEAARLLSGTYGDVTVRNLRRDGHFRIHMRSMILDRVTVTSTEVSPCSVLGARHDDYTVYLPVRGTVRVVAGTVSSVLSGCSGVMISPENGVVSIECHSEECEILTVSIERAVLEDELGVLLGRTVQSTVLFEPYLDFAARSAFHHTLGLLQAMLADPRGTEEHPAMNRRLGRLVASGLLLSQPHPWSEELRRSAGFEGPGAVRAALAAIDEAPLRFTTVGDIAQAVGLSVRALEAGFKRHVGASPMAYLNRVRMARAHEALEGADRELTTATAVAQHWGFSHYGRFASQYRKRYGRSPADTLRLSSGRGDPSDDRRG
ncbi:AraC family transcriptional regulator [Streptomyces sp. NPDC026672]|uniref:AraC family transcriptional regulator n=1 Tax=unclassified Streptomyces TaxID=2593676 RepID=UPI0033F392B2